VAGARQVGGLRRDAAHRNERRGVFQAFNLSILVAALLSHAIAGLLTKDVGWAALAALPGTIGGAWIGARAYKRVSDRRFHEIILVLLCVSRGVLIWTNVWPLRVMERRTRCENFLSAALSRPGDFCCAAICSCFVPKDETARAVGRCGRRRG
jgi:hypothetical protein